MPRARRRLAQRHGAIVWKNRDGSFAGRCRQFCCAQILWTERRGISFFYEAAYKSNPLCLLGRTRTSNAPEQKMFPQLQEWKRRRGGHGAMGGRKGRARGNKMMNLGAK